MKKICEIFENWRIKRNLKQALKEVRLHQQGKIKLKTWDEYLEEERRKK